MIKSLCTYSLFSAMLLAPGAAFAQLLPQQRVQDFQYLVGLYAKRYAPYGWKKQALGFDMFDARPWLDRVRAAKDDLEFLEIAAEYVATRTPTPASRSTPLSMRTWEFSSISTMARC